jgi:hypothetical protein
MSYKQLDYDVVKETAEKLMTAMGSATNLDIKQEVRACGYWATQTIIANMMQDIANDENYTVTNNGRYNTYSLPTVSVNDDEDDDEDDDDDDDDSNTVTVPKRKKGTVKYPTHCNSFTSGDWEVYSVANSTIAFYPSSYTRDEVRQGYALEYGVHFHDTRSRKVK